MCDHPAPLIDLDEGSTSAIGLALAQGALGWGVQH